MFYSSNDNQPENEDAGDNNNNDNDDNNDDEIINKSHQSTEITPTPTVTPLPQVTTLTTPLAAVHYNRGVAAATVNNQTSLLLAIQQPEVRRMLWRRITLKKTCLPSRRIQKSR